MHDLLISRSLSDNEEGHLLFAWEGIGAQLPSYSHSDHNPVNEAVTAGSNGIGAQLRARLRGKDSHSPSDPKSNTQSKGRRTVADYMFAHSHIVLFTTTLAMLVFLFKHMYHDTSNREYKGPPRGDRTCRTSTRFNNGHVM